MALDFTHRYRLSEALANASGLFGGGVDFDGSGGAAVRPGTDSCQPPCAEATDPECRRQ
jgi:hypothetical protein